MVKWATVQLLSLTVELGWNLKATQKTSPILVSIVLVRFHLQLWFVRLVSQEMMKSLYIFGDSELVRNTVEKDIHKNPMDSRTDEALKEIYERLRPGEPKTAESSRSLLVARFFDS